MWWGILLFAGELEQGGMELLLSLPASRWYLGPYRLLWVLLFYSVFIAVAAILLTSRSHDGHLWQSVLLPLPVVLYFGSLSLTLTLLFRNFYFSFALIGAYWILEWLNEGALMGPLHVFVWAHPHPFWAGRLLYQRLCLVAVAAFLLFFSQVLLNRPKRYWK